MIQSERQKCIAELEKMLEPHNDDKNHICAVCKTLEGAIIAIKTLPL